jgi:hypothetical protein
MPSSPWKIHPRVPGKPAAIRSSLASALRQRRQGRVTGIVKVQPECLCSAIGCHAVCHNVVYVSREHYQRVLMHWNVFHLIACSLFEPIWRPFNLSTARLVNVRQDRSKACLPSRTMTKLLIGGPWLRRGWYDVFSSGRRRHPTATGSTLDLWT